MTRDVPEPSHTRASALPSQVLVFGICVAIVFFAWALTPAGGHLKAGSVTLPGVCVLRRATGIPCPGCGMSRSLAHAVRADWQASFTFHRLGPLVLGYVALQLAVRGIWIALPAARTALRRPGRVLNLALIPLMMLVFVNWLFTLSLTLGPA